MLELTTNNILNVMNTLSERIREAVEAAKDNGHTIADIAAECGISVQAVYQWIDPLNNMTELKGSSLAGLSALSGLSPWYINDGKGEKVLFYAKNEAQKATLKVMDCMNIEDQRKMAPIGLTIAQPAEGTNNKQ